MGNGWATPHVARLVKGETVQFRPRGNSMTGRISSGQLVTLEPVREDQVIKKGDIVLGKVHGRWHLHLVTRANHAQDQYQISNNHGFVNGWTSRRHIVGICTAVYA